MEFEELNNAVKKLIEQNLSVYKAQKEFTENASHELQTPLSIIKNKLDLLLQKETLTNRQYQIIEEVNAALARTSRINKNLILLAKMENHQFDDVENIDTGKIIQSSVEQFTDFFKTKNLSLKIEMDGTITVKANRTLLEILINNLLLNAIKHSLPGGNVNVMLGQGKLIVSNPGEISLDNANLFRRFSKGNETSPGSGLGLAIIHEICHRHNWDMAYTFSSGLNQFTLTF